MIVDTREPDIVFQLVSTWFPSAQRRLLDYGDLKGKFYLVERKSINDLIQSTFSGRLDMQLLGFVDYADNEELLPVLAVHGCLLDVEQYYPNAAAIVTGILASAAVRYGVQIVWLPELNSLIEVVCKMELKAREGKLGRPRKPRLRIKLRHEREVANLATLLRIPVNSAREIMHRGGLRWLLQASDAQILLIPGIGEKTLKRIRRMLEGTK